MALADLALGFILITIGAAGALLAVGYWTASDVTLLSFGLFATLYGVRLLLTTPILVPLLGISTAGQALINLGIGYWLPIPGLIFLEQLRGPGWRSSIRRLWQIWIGLAAVFMGYDLAVGAGAVASTASVFVIVMVAVVLAHVVWWGPQKTERGVWPAAWSSSSCASCTTTWWGWVSYRGHSTWSAPGSASSFSRSGS